MNLETISIIVSMIVTLGTFIVLIVNTRSKTTTEYIVILEKRIKDLEDRMIKCEQTRDDLATKNQELDKQKTDLLERIVEQGVIKKLKK